MNIPSNQGGELDFASPPKPLPGATSTPGIDSSSLLGISPGYIVEQWLGLPACGSELQDYLKLFDEAPLQ
jgi:hypothetical protein